MKTVLEYKYQPLAPMAVFRRRVARSIGLAGAVIGVSLSIGVAGYHWIAGQAWIDALLNASMILSGMGPVSDLHSVAAKVFASLYALYSGLVLIAVMGILIAPVAHRMLHRFHLERSPETPRSSQSGPDRK